MNIKKIITVSALILLTSCGRYKTYPTAEKITLVSETSTVTTTKSVTTILRNSDIVYYTKSGKRYHLENPCGKGTYYKCTLEEALKKRLTPCGKCAE